MTPLQKYTVTDKNVMPWAEKYGVVLNIVFSLLSSLKVIHPKKNGLLFFSVC
jgi:hypothetical protein